MVVGHAVNGVGWLRCNQERRKPRAKAQFFVVPRGNISTQPLYTSVISPVQGEKRRASRTAVSYTPLVAPDVLPPSHACFRVPFLDVYQQKWWDLSREACTAAEWELSGEKKFPVCTRPWRFRQPRDGIKMFKREQGRTNGAISLHKRQVYRHTSLITMYSASIAGRKGSRATLLFYRHQLKYKSLCVQVDRCLPARALLAAGYKYIPFHSKPRIWQLPYFGSEWA